MPKFIVINPEGDPVFNCDNQSIFFPSIKACKRAITEELDEPQTTDGKRDFTARDDGWNEKMFQVFIAIDWVMKGVNRAKSSRSKA